MEVYCEQNVPNPFIDKKQKKMRTLNIVRFILLIVGIVLCYLMVMAVFNSPVDKDAGINWGAFALNIVFAILILVPFVLAFVFLGRYINNSNLEFDYLLNSGIFRIIKVINRKKRKKMVEFNISAIESIGKIDSETYDRYAGTREIKKVFAVCDYEHEENIFYLYYGVEGTRYLLHIEPNDEMIMALKRSVSRISIIDKSVKLSSPAKPVVNSSGSDNTK